MFKVSKILKYFVFIATTFAIVGVFYEGMALKWFDIVEVFILAMDVSFIISTLVNLFVDRKTKWIYVNIFSILMIIVAVVMKLFAIAYPIWSLVFWYFYNFLFFHLSVFPPNTTVNIHWAYIKNNLIIYFNSYNFFITFYLRFS